jgi:hypothetical protein
LHFQAYALPAWYGTGLLLAICGVALWKGRSEERLVAGAMLLAALATYALRDPRWRGPQWSSFAIDIAFLVVLIIVSLRTARFWPLTMAAFQLLAVIVHTARILDSTLSAWAYATAEVIFTQLTLVSLAVGTWNTWRDRRAGDISRNADVNPPRL